MEIISNSSLVTNIGRYSIGLVWF